DGKQLSASWSASWLAEEQAYFCVAHNISDRKMAEDLLRESESRIRAIIESMPVGLLIVDNRGYIEMTNIQTDRLFRYRYEDLLGEHISILLSEDEGQNQETFKEFISTHSGPISEMNAVRKDGSTVQVELSLTEFNLHGATKLLAVM